MEDDFRNRVNSYYMEPVQDIIDRLERERKELKKENEQLRDRIARDSEEIQRTWLSPAEAAGLKAEYERLKKALQSDKDSV